MSDPAFKQWQSGKSRRPLLRRILGLGAIPASLVALMAIMAVVAPGVVSWMPVQLQLGSLAHATPLMGLAHLNTPRALTLWGFGKTGNGLAKQQPIDLEHERLQAEVVDLSEQLSAAQHSARQAQSLQEQVTHLQAQLSDSAQRLKHLTDEVHSAQAQAQTALQRAQQADAARLKQESKLAQLTAASTQHPNIARLEAEVAGAERRIAQLTAALRRSDGGMEAVPLSSSTLLRAQLWLQHVAGQLAAVPEWAVLTTAGLLFLLLLLTVTVNAVHKAMARYSLEVSSQGLADSSKVCSFPPPSTVIPCLCSDHSL